MPQSFTADQAAAQITRDLGGWVPALGTPVNLTYAYRASAPSSYPVAGMNGFTRFTAAEIGVAEDALRKWSDVANISFTRAGSGTTGESAFSDNAALLLGNFTGDANTVSTFNGYGTRSYSVSNGVYDRHGQVWIDGTSTNFTAPVFPNNAWRLLEHEIGHMLGLSHPGSYDAAQGTPTYAANAVYAQDTFQYTVMSYFSETDAGNGSNFGRQRPLTPMLHDIAAAQRIYGANMTTRTGNTVYGFNSNTGDQDYTFGSATSERVFCIWDAGGVDAIDASGYALASVINLNQGAFSSMGPLSGSTTTAMTNNISIAFGAVIENAYGGSGADLLIGNEVANTLSGGSGNDTMLGGDGGDLVYGNQNDDLVYGNQGVDTLFGGQGSDTSFGGQGGDAIYGNLGSDAIYGNLGDDVIFGGQGDDLIFGGQGNDVLAGNLGNDTLAGGLGADVFGVGSNGGADLILGFDQAGGDRLAIGAQTYTMADDGAGGTLLTLSGGATIDLAGISQASITAGSFVA